MTFLSRLIPLSLFWPAFEPMCLLNNTSWLCSAGASLPAGSSPSSAGEAYSAAAGGGAAGSGLPSDGVGVGSRRILTADRPKRRSTSYRMGGVTAPLGLFDARRVFTGGEGGGDGAGVGGGPGSLLARLAADGVGEGGSARPSRRCCSCRCLWSCCADRRRSRRL